VLSVTETGSSCRQCVLYVIGGHSIDGSVNTIYQLNIGALFQPNVTEPVLKWIDLSDEDESQSFSPRDKFGGWEYNGK
jgi:hypothetical protein